MENTKKFIDEICGTDYRAPYKQQERDFSGSDK
jgi:hypothetical protein